MRTPADVYVSSKRSMRETLPDHEYADDFEVRRIRGNGSLRWSGEEFFIGEALAGELIGVRPADDGLWSIHLGPMQLGVLHQRSRTVMPAPVNGQ